MKGYQSEVSKTQKHKLGKWLANCVDWLGVEPVYEILDKHGLVRGQYHLPDAELNTILERWDLDDPDTIEKVRQAKNILKNKLLVVTSAYYYEKDKERTN